MQAGLPPTAQKGHAKVRLLHELRSFAVACVLTAGVVLVASIVQQIFFLGGSFWHFFVIAAALVVWNSFLPFSPTARSNSSFKVWEAVFLLMASLLLAGFFYVVVVINFYPVYPATLEKAILYLLLLASSYLGIRRTPRLLSSKGMPHSRLSSGKASSNLLRFLVGFCLPPITLASGMALVTLLGNYYADINSDAAYILYLLFVFGFGAGLYGLHRRYGLKTKTALLIFFFTVVGFAAEYYILTIKESSWLF
ncbi:hypothetical protein D6833_10620 [Candidatus Parcubacteria bacterium]|nr:MAG: hypothetical protein D6833_10620 [Candidatus Parcubacteria bacterium]